ncbi:MAG: flavin monoamine oxidase family protein [Rhizobiaceae bacterium]
MTGSYHNTDVIIVGAGTSGLSAARALKSAGVDTLVVEAADHVGGRCVTENGTFSVPFDRGGSWLHSAEINPLARLAETEGVTLHKKSWRWERVFSDGHTLSETEVNDYSKYMDLMWDRVNQMGIIQPKAAIDQVLPDGPWKDTAKMFVAQMLGGDFDATSAADSANYADAEGDWLVAGGLGNFVRHLHLDIEVVLNCPVSKIDYSGPNVRATTPMGTIEARHLILTVSTGVLAAEKIEFEPKLSYRKLQAIDQLPNGLLNKIAIEFDPSWKEVHEGYMADYHQGDDEYCTILFRSFDSDLSVGFVAGRFADQLECQGEGAATEFCLTGLKELFGSDVIKYIRKTSETEWRANANTIGSYSFARPGYAGAREILAETVDERLFFAGEATMPNTFATVHGAYLSGKETAQKVLGCCRGFK